MTLNTTAETETAKIARGLRERDMELLAGPVERYQHRKRCLVFADEGATT